MKKLILILSIFCMSSVLFAQLDRSVAPEPQPNPDIKIDIPESMTFANGLRVIMVENHKLPVVSFQLFVDYPTPMEGDKAGVSSIFGSMLESGTQSTPKDAFDEKIDYIGATFSTNSRGFYASSLKKHTPELLGLLKQVLMEPAFTQEDFDRIVSQNMSNLASIPSDASSMSSNVSSVVNYGKNHPYGEVMTEETLGNITLDDVKAYYKKNFIPNHAYLVIVGDITKDDVKGYVGEYFEPWAKGETLSKTEYITPKAKGNNVYFVNKPGAVQSVIRITHNVELTPGHPDEIKLRVLNQILGGGSFSARLMSNLREDKAYTYGCYSSLSSDPLMGSFSAGGSFRNEVTDSAIVQILTEISRIADEHVTDKELDLVKKSMTGSFARSLESPQTIARFALNTIRYDLPADYYSSYLKRLERVTKEDLLLVAAQYLSPSNLNIIVVGNEEIAEKLNVFDTDGKIDFKNYYGEDEEQLKTVAEGVTAESIINNYVMNVMMVKNETELAAKLKKVKQLETVSRAEIKEYSAVITAYSVTGAPNKSAAIVRMSSPMGTQELQKEWFNGEAGGSVSGTDVTVYEGEELASKKVTSFPVSQAGYFDNKNLTIELLGIKDMDGVDHYKIKITDGEDITLEYYNVSTGLLSVSERFMTDDNGETVTAITSFSNYEAKEGVYLPTKSELNTQGQVLTLNEIYRKVGKKAKSKAYSNDFKKIYKLLETL